MQYEGSYFYLEAYEILNELAFVNFFFIANLLLNLWQNCNACIGMVIVIAKLNMQSTNG